MGNITKRGSKELVADAATPQDDTSVTTLHSRLYGAIIKEDCNTIKKLLRTHPVNQPLNVLVNPTSCRLLLNQVLPFRHFKTTELEVVVTLLIPALWRLRQEDSLKFKASVGYIVNPRFA